jgi:magnesium and cobalt transporter
LSEHLPSETQITGKIFLAALGVFLMLIIAETCARLLLLSLDIAILKISMPLIKFLYYTILFPVVFVMEFIEDKMENLTQDEDKDEKATAEDEILSLVESDDDDDKNSLEEDEKRMIKGIFDLDDTPVREIMTPRVDVTALPLDASIEDAKQEFVKSGHSRIPIYEDRIDEIKAIIMAKDFLDDSNLEGKTLGELGHVPIFIPETKAVGDLLEEVKITNNHFAVIIDEYGGTSGIVTLEDIIEEIVGDIRDEYDTEDDAEPEPQFNEDGSITIDARMNIDDLNDLLETDISTEDADTIGGFVCGEMGKIPEDNEELVLDEKLKITVLKADKRRIISLKLELLEDRYA